MRGRADPLWVPFACYFAPEFKHGPDVVQLNGVTSVFTDVNI